MALRGRHLSRGIAGIALREGYLAEITGLVIQVLVFRN
jgi:hypothetical protein